MRFKLLAPVETDFSIVSDLPIRDPDAYTRFWDDVQEGMTLIEAELRAAVPAGIVLPSEPELRLAHTSEHRRYAHNRYQSLESDSLERPLHVLELSLSRPSFTDWTSADNDDRRSWLTDHLERITCRVFDHGITLIEVDIPLGDLICKTPPEEIPDMLDELQRAGIALGEYVAVRCANELLRPVFNWIRTPRRDAFIEPPRVNGAATSNGKVLWVTRTLIFEKGDATNRDETINHWLKDSGGNDVQDGQTLAERIAGDDRTYMTRWLNYLFREKSYVPPPADERDPDQLAHAFCDVWEGMLHAQFFYAAMDVVDLRLSRILAEAYSRDTRLTIREMKDELEVNIRKSNLLLLKFHDSSKYFKRTVKDALDDILKYWEFDLVLIQPVQHKIRLCEERLNLLHKKASARAAIYTDLILLLIGVTAIFGTLLGLAEYFRTMTHDVNFATYEFTNPDLVADFASLPAHSILLGAAVLSLVVVGAYYFLRRRQTV